MDNFTHSLAGWALGQAGLKRKTGLGMAALILGANMPDIDVVLEPLFGLPSIQYHRGFTHGVGGVAIMPFLLACLLLALDRWQGKQGDRSAEARWWQQWNRRPLGRDTVRFGWLVALCYIGTLTHPALDFMNTYGIQLLAPFSERWFHGDTLFIIDVWVWSILAFSIWLSRRWEKRKRTEWRRPAIVGLCAALVYICANGLLSLKAEHATRALAQGFYGISPDFVMAGEVPIAFWRREIIWRRGTTLGRTSYDALSGRMATNQTPIDTNMADPAVAKAARQDRQLAAFLNWSLVPVARVERGPNETLVKVGDARFSDARTASGFSRTVRIAGDR